MLTTLDSAIDSVNNARGVLGAQQNRLDSTLRSLSNVRENTSLIEAITLVEKLLRIDKNIDGVSQKLSNI